MDWIKRILLIVSIPTFVTTNVHADFTLGSPKNLGPLVNHKPQSNTSCGNGSSCTSTDELELYFTSYRVGGMGDADLWVTTRKAVEDPWEDPMNLGATVNSSGVDEDPSLSKDGLTLFFTSNRQGGQGGRDIWMTHRTSNDSPWEIPVNLGTHINSPEDDCDPFISHNSLQLLFTSNRPGGYGVMDIWRIQRFSIIDPWSEPVNCGCLINSSEDEQSPCMSNRKRLLFYIVDAHGITPTQSRSTPCNGPKIIVSRCIGRTLWREPYSLTHYLNLPENIIDLSLSTDERTMYITSDQNMICTMDIRPMLDFNSDGFIDTHDLHDLLDHWNTTNSLYDIGPTPLGDGTVDHLDLLVLTEYIVAHPCREES